MCMCVGGWVHAYAHTRLHVCVHLLSPCTQQYVSHAAWDQATYHATAAVALCLQACLQQAVIMVVVELGPTCCLFDPKVVSCCFVPAGVPSTSGNDGGGGGGGGRVGPHPLSVRPKSGQQAGEGQVGSSRVSCDRSLASSMDLMEQARPVSASGEAKSSGCSVLTSMKLHGTQLSSLSFR